MASSWPVVLENDQQERFNRGAISLEAAVVLPLFIMFTLAWIILLLGVEAGIRWQGGVYKAGREIALLQCVGAFAAEGPDSSKLKAGPAEQPEEESVTALKELAGGWGRSRLTGPVVAGLAEGWFQTGTEGKPYLRKYTAKKKLFLAADKKKNLYRLKSFYQQPAIFTDRPGSAATDIGNWSLEGGLEAGGQVSGPWDDDSIWSAGNFVRGSYFRERAGANLPANYPVIASFSGGTATSVKSIDLTAPDYSNLETLRRKVQGHLCELADFSGTGQAWGKQQIKIRAEDVRFRVLEIIVPENSPTVGLFILESMKAEAEKDGVILQIHKRGSSRRYGESKKADERGLQKVELSFLDKVVTLR